MTDSSKYIGDELALFENAHNWKKYYGNIIKPFLKGRVLEVGAGIGATTLHLCDGSQKEWVCLEPDPALGKRIPELINEKKLHPYCEYINGTLDIIPAERKFNAIIYIDVIEHIEDDVTELKNASLHLEKDGYLIILVPAHQFLFSPFDKAIGHHRRYSLDRLRFAVPKKLNIVKALYLDSIGLTASFANKLFLKQNYPTLKQILFWDRSMVKISRLIDPLLFHRMGKSCLLIAQKT